MSILFRGIRGEIFLMVKEVFDFMWSKDVPVLISPFDFSASNSNVKHIL